MKIWLFVYVHLFQDITQTSARKAKHTMNIKRKDRIDLVEWVERTNV